MADLLPDQLRLMADALPDEVAFTNVANCALVTAVASRRYGARVTLCVGVSPSVG